LATPLERKLKPKRRVIVIASTIAVFFLYVIWAFFSEALQRSKSDPEQAGKLKLIKQYPWDGTIAQFRFHM